MKKRFKINTIRGRAYLTIIALALLSLLICGLIVSHLVGREITRNYEIAKETTIAGLSYTLAPMLESYDYTLVERLITATLDQGYVASIAVYDNNRTLISSAEEEAAASKAINLETYTITGDGGVVGSLDIGIYTGYISTQVRSTVLALISGLAIIFTVGGSLFFGLFDRFISRPLSYLSKKVTEMTPENLLVRVEQTRDDEFGTLSRNINEMAGRLQEYDASRKKAEEMLRQSEERFRLIFEYAPDAYYLNDLEGNFVNGNKAAEKLSGYIKEELIGKSFLKLNMLRPQDIQKAAELLIRNANGQSTGPDEFSLIRKDGSQVIVEISTFPVKIHGQALVLAIARDITERKQMEGQLIITDRLASVGELASGIAHELNNPLTGIIGLSQLLAEKNMPEDSKEDLQLIYREAQRAANIVRGLLSFAHRHPPERQLINVNDIISKVVELRAYEQKVSNIETIANLAPDLPQISADYFQMQQVFLNIVTNAEYFMLKAHNKGTLTITTGMVGDIVRISFADDGPGIPERDLGHLFDPFFTTKEVGKGTGLGLSISHGIVTAHGGRIYPESEQGKGAVFVVELPIRQKE